MLKARLAHDVNQSNLNSSPLGEGRPLVMGLSIPSTCWCRPTNAGGGGGTGPYFPKIVYIFGDQS